MRSRAARVTSGLVAWIALVGSVFFLLASQRILDERRANVRNYEFQVRQAAEALGGLRAAQQAYIADGQGADYWAPRVSFLLESAASAVDALKSAAATAAARGVLVEAASNIALFASIDRQARAYLDAGQELMASDVIFASGGEASQAALRQIEASLLAEHQSFDLAEIATRRQQAYVVGGAATLILVVIGLLALGAPAADRARTESAAAQQPGAIAERTGTLDLGLRAGPQTSPPVAEQPRVPLADLQAAADLCTRFGTVSDVADLRDLLAGAAAIIDAGGVIVWLGSTTGADLRPAVAHGYSDEALVRMRTIPQSANNATAQAYRSGRLQIVMAKPGVAQGAVVVPLLSSDGTIGVLSAEIEGGGETSDAVQALATLFAAQLATLLAPSVDTPQQVEDIRQERSASA